MQQFCFYLDWQGWKPEVWAAWVQAICSVAAIWAAGRLARKQDRLSVSRKVEVYVNLIASAMDTTRVVHTNAMKGLVPRTPFNAFTKSAVLEFTQLQEALESIPLQDLPDYRLMDPIRTAHRTCSRMLEALSPEYAFEGNDAKQVAIGLVDECLDSLTEAYSSAASTVNELIDRSLLQRFRYWWHVDRARRDRRK